MSVEADDPREALFVFCLVSCRLVSPPQAIKEWIADAPLWPCRLQDPPPDLVFHDAPPGCGRSIPDDEPDLDWFNRPRNPSNPDPDGYDQSQTWQAPEIHLDDTAPAAIAASRKAQRHRRSRAKRGIIASWFSNPPEDPDRLAEKPPPKELLAKRLGELRSR